MKKFEIEPKNKYFEVISSFADQEVFVAPSVRFTTAIDMTAIETFRNTHLQGQIKISYTTFVIKALALTLQKFQYANRRVVTPFFKSLFGLRVQRFLSSDIAIAAESNMNVSESFAFFDVLRTAEKLGLNEINLWLKDLSNADRTNNEQLNSFCTVVERCPVWLSKIILGLPKWFPSLWAQYRGGAAMVNSFSKYGVDQLSATWLFPLVVSFGYVKDDEKLQNGLIKKQKSCQLFMTFDRRIMAGAKAAQFFNHIVQLLETCPTEITKEINP